MTTSFLRTTPATLWLLLALGLFATLGSLPLFDLDEGAFSQATQEMRHSGNYAATTLNGEPRYDKPVGIYWLQAASVALFGVSEWAFRFPSALAALLWAGVFWQFIDTRLGRTRAHWGAVMLLGSLGTSIIAQAAIADALLNLLLTLSMTDLYREFEAPSRKQRLRIYLWMGLGFLVKGPVAVLIPLLASGAFYALSGKIREWSRGLFEWRGWLVLLAVVAPWLLAVYNAQGWDFFVGFFGEHNLGRFTHTREGHGGSLFYYLWALPLVLMPFSGLFIAALGHARHLWKEPLYRFALIWSAVVFLLVSVSATQLPHYVLYASPAFFLLALTQIRDGGHPWVFGYIPALWIALLASLPFVLPFVDTSGMRPYDAAIVQLAASEAETGSRVLALSIVVGVLILAARVRSHALGTLAGMAALQWVTVHLLVLPLLAGAQQAPVKKAGLIVAERHQTAVMNGLRMPSFSVYAGQTTPRREPHVGELALVRTDRTPDICLQNNCTTLYARGGIRLLEVGPAKPQVP